MNCISLVRINDSDLNKSYTLLNGVDSIAYIHTINESVYLRDYFIANLNKNDFKVFTSWFNYVGEKNIISLKEKEQLSREISSIIAHIADFTNFPTTLYDLDEDDIYFNFDKEKLLHWLKEFLDLVTMSIESNNLIINIDCEN